MFGDLELMLIHIQETTFIKNKKHDSQYIITNEALIFGYAELISGDY